MKTFALLKKPTDRVISVHVYADAINPNGAGITKLQTSIGKDYFIADIASGFHKEALLSNGCMANETQ